MQWFPGVHKAERLYEPAAVRLAIGVWLNHRPASREGCDRIVSPTCVGLFRKFRIANERVANSAKELKRSSVRELSEARNLQIDRGFISAFAA